MNSRFTDDDAIASRLAARLVGALTARAEVLPAGAAERLRFARERAEQRARELRLSAADAPAVVGFSPMGAASAGTFGRFAPWWQRAMSLLPLAVLLVGLLGIDRWSSREQVLAAAEIDTQLLADDLPPSAYTDPGFAEYLRSGPPP